MSTKQGDAAARPLLEAGNHHYFDDLPSIGSSGGCCSPNTPPFFSAEDVPATRRLANVLIMTVGFTMVFISYSTLQAYVSSLLPGDLGFQSLVVLYVAFVVFLVFAPFFCDLLGDVGAMVLGSTGYIVYVLSLVIGEPTLILAGSVVLGFGSSLLWVGQGAALTRWSTGATRGKNAGIFWGGYQLSSVLGPMTSYVVLTDVPEAQKVTLLFSVMTAVSVVATGTFALCYCPCVRIVFRNHLRPAAATAAGGDNEGEDGAGSALPATPTETPPATPPATRSCISRICQPVLRGLELCRTREIALMLMPCLFTGVEAAFSSGEYFKLVGLLPCNEFADNESMYVCHGMPCVLMTLHTACRYAR
jgi:hypothetical protein